MLEETLGHLGFEEITNTPQGMKTLVAFDEYERGERPLSVWFSGFDMSLVFDPRTGRVWGGGGRFQFIPGDFGCDITDEVMSDSVRQILRRRRR